MNRTWSLAAAGIVICVFMTSQASADCYTLNDYTTDNALVPYDECQHWIRRWPAGVSKTVYVSGTPAPGITLSQTSVAAQTRWDLLRAHDTDLPQLSFEVGEPPNPSTDMYIRWTTEAEYPTYMNATPNPGDIAGSRPSVTAAGTIARFRMCLLKKESIQWALQCAGYNVYPADDCYKLGYADQNGISWNYDRVDLNTVMLHELGHFAGLLDTGSCQEPVSVTCMYGGLRYNIFGQLYNVRTAGSDDEIALGTLQTTPLPGPEQLEPCAIIPILRSITATATAEVGRIRLEWFDENPSLGSNAYTISRGTDCRGPFEFVEQVPGTSAQEYVYYDYDIEELRTYFYSVSDTDCGFTSAEPLSGSQPASAPAPPTNLAVEWTGASGTTRTATVSWNAPSGQLDGYRVWRSVDGLAIGCSEINPDSECPYNFSWGTSESTSITDVIGPVSSATYMVSAYIVQNGNYSYSSASVATLPCKSVSVSILDNMLAMCPSGDGDSLVVDVTLEQFCELDLMSPFIAIVARRAASTSRDLTLWEQGSAGAVVTDSLRGTFDPATRICRIVARNISGCGQLVLNVFANGKLVAADVAVEIRGTDQTPQTLGAVDRFDHAAIGAAYISDNVPCWDLNWQNAMPDVVDVGIFSLHAAGRHHVSRKLLAPNGGEVYGPGDLVPITWQAGLGDSARVTLRVVHSTPDTSMIVSDVLDTGSYSWLVPPTNKAGTDSRVEVLHSAGYYKVDYADVGRDASDDTMTFRATAVSDLAVVTGKNTAVLSWSDPYQGTTAAEEHEIWYRHSSPLTNEEFTSGSTRLVFSPGVVGTTHCVEINFLTQCRTYYFGMRTKDRGVWSKLSNVAVAQTACSGFQVVFCEESGLMAGGGGGEGELAQATRLASATSPLSAMGSEAATENSLLCGNRGDVAEDLYCLTAGSALLRGISEVVLRESSLREAAVDAVGLGVVAHPSGTEAFPGGGTIWIGTGRPIDRARDSAGADVSAALAAADEDGVGFRGGDVVTIELGGDAGRAALVLESRNRVFAARDDSSGILVQRPDRSGTWSTTARVHPRREFDRQAIPAEGASTLRLVFLKEYSLRALNCLDGITAATPRVLSLADASHSRVGTVDGAVDRSGGEKTSLAMGDTLTLRFTPLEPEPGMEHSYFFSIRGSVETAAEDTRLQDAVSLVVPAGPAFSNALGAARPNPTSGGAVIAYMLAAPGQAELSIYDVSGRRIRTVLSANRPMGAHEVQWDGRDAGGRAVPAGVYFYRLQAGSWQSERKLIVIQ